MPLADGFLVGSTLRQDGKFLGRLDPKRLRTFVSAFHEARDHEWNSSVAAPVGAPTYGFR
jgi:hypothetical protein